MEDGVIDRDTPAPVESVCPNCGSRSLGRYCADCGQAAPTVTDYSFRAQAADLIDQIASVDGRALRTLWALVARPGALTTEHLHGRRAQYLRPLQLFLLVNVVLFIAAPRIPLFSYSLANYLAHAPPSPSIVATLVQRRMATVRPLMTPGPAPVSRSPMRGLRVRPAYVAAFDARVEAQRKSFVILFAPVLALILRLLFAHRLPTPGVPHRYGEHFVFALHLLTFIWLLLTVWGGIVALAAGRTFAVVDGTGLVMLAVMVALPSAAALYLYRAVRRVYDFGTLESIALTGALAGAFIGCLAAYRTLLFFTTYYTL